MSRGRRCYRPQKGTSRRNDCSGKEKKTRACRVLTTLLISSLDRFENWRHCSCDPFTSCARERSLIERGDQIAEDVVGIRNRTLFRCSDPGSTRGLASLFLQQDTPTSECPTSPSPERARRCQPESGARGQERSVPFRAPPPSRFKLLGPSTPTHFHHPRSRLAYSSFSPCRPGHTRVRVDQFYLSPPTSTGCSFFTPRHRDSTPPLRLEF